MASLGCMYECLAGVASHAVPSCVGRGVWPGLPPAARYMRLRRSTLRLFPGKRVRPPVLSQVRWDGSPMNE